MPVPQVTIESYLRSRCLNYPLPQENIYVAMASQGIEEDSLAYPIPEPEGWEKQRDLAEAEIYEIMGNFVNGGGESQKIGNRSYSSGTVQVAADTREYWHNKANILRIKWGLTPITEELEIFDQTDLW